jgi:hypothetical protein
MARGAAISAALARHATPQLRRASQLGAALGIFYNEEPRFVDFSDWRTERIFFRLKGACPASGRAGVVTIGFDDRCLSSTSNHQYTDWRSSHSYGAQFRRHPKWQSLHPRGAKWSYRYSRGSICADSLMQLPFGACDHLANRRWLFASPFQ